MRGHMAFFAALTLALVPMQSFAKDDPQEGPRAAFNEFISAFNALDWNRFQNGFADTVSLFNPDIPEAISLHRLDGRVSVLNSFRKVFDTAEAVHTGVRGPDIHPERVQIQRFDDTAIITFEFQRAQNSLGRRTIVFNKQQGSWRIVHIHASNIRQR